MSARSAAAFPVALARLPGQEHRVRNLIARTVQECGHNLLKNLVGGRHQIDTTDCEVSVAGTKDTMKFWAIGSNGMEIPFPGAGTPDTDTFQVSWAEFNQLIADGSSLSDVSATRVDCLRSH